MQLPPGAIAAFADELEKIAGATTDPEQLKKLLKPGDILYTRPKNIDKLHHRMFYAIESRVQGSPFTHVGLYVGDGMVVDAGAWKKGQSTGTKVHRIPIDRFLDRYQFKVLRVKAKPAEKEEAVEYAKQQVGKDFNMKGMLRLILPFKGSPEGERERKRAAENFFCSELVANAYQNVGLAKDKKLHHVMPGDIHRSSKTKTVAEFK